MAKAKLHKIESALIDATGLEAKANEKRPTWLARLARGANKLDEDTWEQLDEAAASWAANAADRLKAKEELIEPAEYNEEEHSLSDDESEDEDDDADDADDDEESEEEESEEDEESEDDDDWDDDEESEEEDADDEESEDEESEDEESDDESEEDDDEADDDDSEEESDDDEDNDDDSEEEEAMTSRKGKKASKKASKKAAAKGAAAKTSKSSKKEAPAKGKGKATKEAPAKKGRGDGPGRKPSGNLSRLRKLVLQNWPCRRAELINLAEEKGIDAPPATIGSVFFSTAQTIQAMEELGVDVKKVLGGTKRKKV
jgi:hypothetical protein